MRNPRTFCRPETDPDGTYRIVGYRPTDAEWQAHLAEFPGDALASAPISPPAPRLTEIERRVAYVLGLSEAEFLAVKSERG